MMAAPPGSPLFSKAMARAPASRASMPAATPAPPAPTIAMSVSYCLTLAIGVPRDRKSTRLNSSHLGISYAVFCLKKKKKDVTTGIAEHFDDSELRYLHFPLSIAENELQPTCASTESPAGWNRADGDAQRRRAEGT